MRRGRQTLFLRTGATPPPRPSHCQQPMDLNPKQSLSHCRQEREIRRPTWKTAWQVFIQLTIHPRTSQPRLGTYQGKWQHRPQEAPHVGACSSFTYTSHALDTTQWVGIHPQEKRCKAAPTTEHDSAGSRAHEAVQECQSITQAERSQGKGLSLRDSVSIRFQKM